MAIQYFILLTHSLFANDFNECSTYRDSTKITVIGTAIVNKNQAGVLTDDSLLYYLTGKYNWSPKYKGKRVKVTGKLDLTEYPRAIRSPNPEIFVPPQPRLRDGKFIKEAKWRLIRKQRSGS